MNNMEQNEKHRLRRARMATVLVSLIAISSVALAIYAFQQKREAEIQTKLAEQRAIEALQLQKNAVEQRNIADSNKEKAEQQREYALENERNVLLQKAIADSESAKAKRSQQEAITQQHLAVTQRNIADTERKIAEANGQKAILLQDSVEVQRGIVENEKATSDKLKGIEDSHLLAKESVLLLNENLPDSSKNKAIQAYLLNKNNDGPLQNNDIYNALNSNWIKNINYRNQSAIHARPVHCITGMHGSNIIFTADESGMLYESVIRNNNLQKITSYAVKQDVRALAVSPDGNKLVAITASGDGIVLTLSPSGISLLTNFKFPGTGKVIAF